MLKAFCALQKYVQHLFGSSQLSNGDLFLTSTHGSQVLLSICFGALLIFLLHPCQTVPNCGTAHSFFL